MHASRDFDDGFSLVEILIAVVILGICFTGLLSGMGMSVLASDIHRSQADGHAVLVSAAEAVKDNERNPFVCPATVSTYNPSLGVTAPPGWTISGSAANSDVDVTSVEYGYWNGTAFPVVSGCSAADLQRIKLTASSPDTRAAESVSILKRKP